MRAQLVPLDGGSPIDVTKDLTLVGRKEDCDLRLDHKSVSKMHCVIVKTDGMLLLRDLGSTNGTRVNGQRVRRAVLLPNDQLSIANYKFKVYLGPDAPPPAHGAALREEHTQQLDAKEVASLLKQARAGGGRATNLDDSVEDLPPSPPLQHNPLPDVYPEEGSHG
jgi:pSer/pThr/pTyr-binding forkhead associated (FHA) protein